METGSCCTTDGITFRGARSEARFRRRPPSRPRFFLEIRRQTSDTNGTDLSKIEILVILIINVLRLSDAAKSCLSP